MINKNKISSNQVIAWLGSNVKYVLFLIGLSFLTIMNSHIAENKIRQIVYLKKEVKELNWKYLTLKSSWMNEASLSNLEGSLEEDAVGKEGSKPRIIKAQKNQ